MFDEVGGVELDVDGGENDADARFPLERNLDDRDSGGGPADTFVDSVRTSAE